MAAAATLLLAIVQATVPQLPNGVVHGTVSGRAGRPLAAAIVIREGLPPETTRTDSAGRYALALPAAGRSAFRIVAVGYGVTSFLVTVERPESVGVDVPLEPVPVVLDTIEVAGHPELLGNRNLLANGFAERLERARRMASQATFFTPEDIARRRPQRMSHLVNTARGVRMQWEGAKAIPYGRNNQCVMSLWVDGHELQNVLPALRGGLSGMRLPSPGERVVYANPRPGEEEPQGLDFIPMNDIAAIEVYPSAVATPPEFQSLKNNCGAIVIWTKT